MYIDFFLENFKINLRKQALIWHDKVYTYEDMYNLVSKSEKELRQKINMYTVVAIEADFSPRSAAVLLVLIEMGCIIVPLTESVSHKKQEFKEIAEVEAIVFINRDDTFRVEYTGIIADHKLLLRLKKQKHPGLVLFSSGTTGKSKAAVHDFVPLLKKFKIPRKTMKMVTFLLFDHIGGINTLLYILSNTGCIITLNSRKPEDVCELIEKYKAEVLPTSPTFINLILLSEAYKEYDISSLKMVTYGTEVMPESTLKRFNELFPNIRMLQTYGLSEIGIMRSKSKASDSLWVKIGGEDFHTRVINGILEIKAKSAMLGYLNAPSPFTEDGWFHTGDAVLVDGEYMKILGRQSEIINVGGQKVYPAEVESIIQQIDNVEEVAVNAEKNVITGEIVKARIKLKNEENVLTFKKRMRNYCKDKMESFKIPQKIIIVDKSMYGERFKKLRRE